MRIIRAILQILGLVFLALAVAVMVDVELARRRCQLSP